MFILFQKGYLIFAQFVALMFVLFLSFVLSNRSYVIRRFKECQQTDALFLRQKKKLSLAAQTIFHLRHILHLRNILHLRQ